MAGARKETMVFIDRARRMYRKLSIDVSGASQFALTHEQVASLGKANQRRNKSRFQFVIEEIKR